MRQKLIIFAVFILTIAFVKSSISQIVINEILASNTSTNIDKQHKQFTDWIELYNESDQSVSIGNWYLSDNIEKPTKWKIPIFYSITAKGYRLFCADNTNTSNHTNFKLNIDGETIYLFDKDTLLVDSLNYPQQIRDISYGKLKSTHNEMVYFQKATPAQENPNSGISELTLCEHPQFSVPGGFFAEEINLELSSSPNDQIYYTLDGSKPDLNSLVYTSAISINQTTTLRVRTYSPDKLPSKIITQTYFINEQSSLPVVALAISPEYLFDENHGIYVPGKNFIQDEWNTANYFQDWERPVHLQYFDTDKKEGFSLDAGIRIHGRSTRNNAQKSLAIFAREKYGQSLITEPIFGEKSPKAFKSFLLRTGGNDWGLTMFLDGLFHTLVIDKIDIDAQLYQPANVFLNGEYYGIHNIREKINKYYIENKYPDKTSKFDIIEADLVVGGEMNSCHGNMSEYAKLKEFFDQNDLSIEANYENVSEWIDINELINYLITQVYICNKDWPNSNMKFWKYRNESGKWRWILYDTELSATATNKFAQFNMLEHLLDVDSEFYSTDPWSNYLFRKLFENESFKNEFLQRMSIYLGTIFESNHVLEVLDSLKQNIQPEIERSLRKWGGIKQIAFPHQTTSRNLEEWELNIKYIQDFFETRPGLLRRNTVQFFNLNDTVNLKLRTNDSKAGTVKLMGYTLKEADVDIQVFSNIPIRMEAIPNEGYTFVKWKGGGEEQSCELTLRGDKKITAVFEKDD